MADIEEALLLIKWLTVAYLHMTYAGDVTDTMEFEYLEALVKLQVLCSRLVAKKSNLTNLNPQTIKPGTLRIVFWKIPARIPASILSLLEPTPLPHHSKWKNTLRYDPRAELKSILGLRDLAEQQRRLDKFYNMILTLYGKTVRDTIKEIISSLLELLIELNISARGIRWIIHSRVEATFPSNEPPYQFQVGEIERTLDVIFSSASPRGDRYCSIEVSHKKREGEVIENKLRVVSYQKQQDPPNTPAARPR